MESQAALLHDPAHQVMLYYTLKHASWMNQVEIWLSILVRKLLKRGNFRSLNDLRDQILAFIAYLQSHDGQTRQMDVQGAHLIVESFLPQCTSRLWKCYPYSVLVKRTTSICMENCGGADVLHNQSSVACCYEV